jgi:ankyrin repeat protein
MVSDEEIKTNVSPFAMREGEIKTFDGKDLKQQFFNGKIDVKKYLEIVNENNLKLPTSEEIKKYITSIPENEKNKILINSSYLNYVDGIKYVINNVNEFKKHEALSIACSENSIDVVKYLIEHGVDFNKYYESNINELLKHNSFEILKYLIDNNIIDITDDKYILSESCKYENNLKIVEYLINQGFDINLYNGEALYNAIENDNYDIVKYLIEHGAIIDEYHLNIITTREIRILLKKYYIKHDENDENDDTSLIDSL